MSSSSSCPFDVIVITSPDQKAAVAARQLIISSCADFSSSLDSSQSSSSSSLSSGGTLISTDGTIFISSCDPYGTRLGSGGGTLAALYEAREAYYQINSVETTGDGDANDGGGFSEPTVLICHAGGESSRCPTQITLGKAWTSLPIHHHHHHRHHHHHHQHHHQQEKEEEVVLNPTSLLIATLSTIFQNVPRGSVVVAASDVLLSFQHCSNNSAITSDVTKVIHFNETHGGVIGLAVPAPLSTAKNHGVFVLDDEADDKDDHDDNDGNKLSSSENLSQNDNNKRNDANTTIRGAKWRLQSTYRVLQKPSIDEMISMSTPSCTFVQHDNQKIAQEKQQQGQVEEEEEERMAWIDTGVITFLPDAVSTLNELSTSTLKSCTRSGLRELYHERYGGIGGSGGGNDNTSSLASQEERQQQLTLEEFAKIATPKICLYGDMLHALQTTSSSPPSATSSSPATSSNHTESSLLYDALSKHKLQTCTIPEGAFVHLGTTGELIDFLVAGATATMTNTETTRSGGRDNSNMAQKQLPTRIQSFAQSIGIFPRSNAFISGFDIDDNDDVSKSSSSSVVILNSMLIGDSSLLNSKSSIGHGSVIEHCTIFATDGGKMEIGQRCLLSGIRGNVIGKQLSVPSKICLQMLPLRDGRGFVCLCFGVNDDIKGATTLYGMDLNFVLERSGLTPSDIWDESIPISRRMLWNAKLHPIMICEGGDGKCPELDFSFLDWIKSLRDNSDDERQRQLTSSSTIHGLTQWKQSERIAISDIRTFVDSEVEAKYRSTISSAEVKQLNLVTDCLISQKHESCTFDYLINNDTSYSKKMKRLLKALDNVAYQAAEDGKYQIVGRTFMVMSEVLRSLGDDSVESELVPNDLPSSLTSESIRRAIAIRDTLTRDRKYYSCSQVLEDFASKATQCCISGGNEPSFVYTDPLPLDTTATASAPARIDLAGGWSDTPPISFEYGGAVACLAVLVDGKRPLRAQCKVVGGMTGVCLRTESRSLSDENMLLYSSETTVQTLADLDNFSNPESECSLLKCALVWLRLCPLKDVQDGNMKTQSIQPYVHKFCQREGEADVGLEITSSSLLPTGSGMGSSSILAGCIIACIAKCVGIVLDGVEPIDQSTARFGSTETNGTNSLIHGVLMVEQLLTSGGGWQDQIGGLVGGLKLATSSKSILPLETKTKRVELTEETVDKLNKRLILVDTGKPRLAKNILRNVLRRWGRRSADIVETVRELVNEASNAIDYATNGDVDNIGSCMSKYWELKKAMAGESSGVEPENIKQVLQLLTSSNKIVGGTLCGAGGGGFLALMAADGTSQAEIESTVMQMRSEESDMDGFKWHSCTVATEGLVIDTFDCKQRKAELHDKELFMQPACSHMGECPICCLPLSIDLKKSLLTACCCKYICKGCDYANWRRETEAGLEHRCPYCRIPRKTSQEEVDKRVMERIKKKDPVAMTEMGKRHLRGGEYEKALQYYIKAAELGDADAHACLGMLYYDGDGVEKDEKKAVYHWERAAIGGHPQARHNLAVQEKTNGRLERTAKHFIIAANLGNDGSLKCIKVLFLRGVVSKEEYTAALRGYQAAVDATKSAEREKAEEAEKTGIFHDHELFE
jgi:galactokinase/mevalonate kinase-like predicted kinase/tetratricopeptide (TPR) repeat protein